MPQNTRLNVVRGETFILPINLFQADGTPKDTTNITFTGSLKESYTSVDVTPFTFITLTPLTSGSLEVQLDTTPLKAGEYVYTMFLVSGSVRRPMLEGQFKIRQSTL
jgi:hypothetical protein